MRKLWLFAENFRIVRKISELGFEFGAFLGFLYSTWGFVALMRSIEGFMTCSGNGSCVWKVWVNMCKLECRILREDAIQLEVLVCNWSWVVLGVTRDLKVV